MSSIQTKPTDAINTNIYKEADGFKASGGFNNHFAMVRIQELLINHDGQLICNDEQMSPIKNCNVFAGYERFKACRNPKIRPNIFTRRGVNEVLESD